MLFPLFVADVVEGVAVNNNDDDDDDHNVVGVDIVVVALVVTAVVSVPPCCGVGDIEQEIDDDDDNRAEGALGLLLQYEEMSRCEGQNTTTIVTTQGNKTKKTYHIHPNAKPREV